MNQGREFPAQFGYDYPDKPRSLYHTFHPSASPSQDHCNTDNGSNSTYNSKSLFPQKQQQQEIDRQQQTHSNDTSHARAYRSRKDRPCDSCRRRKTRCTIEEAGQNCQSCQLNKRSCTFEMSPTPRSRPEKNGEGGGSVTQHRKRSYSTQSQQSVGPSSSSSPLPDYHEESRGPKGQRKQVKQNNHPNATASVNRLHALVSTMLHGQDEESENYRHTLEEGVSRVRYGAMRSRSMRAHTKFFVCFLPW
jgi:hypothetical protein